MDLIHKANIAIRRVGFINTIRFIRYARMRDRLERQTKYDKAWITPEVPPGNLQSVDQVQRGSLFQFEYSQLEVRFLANDVVRFSWSPGSVPLPYSIAQEDWPLVQLAIHENEDGWQLESDQVRVQIGDEGSTRFTNTGGKSLRRDRPPLRSDPPDTNGKPSLQEPYWSLRTSLEPECHIYGLGLRASPMNLRGRSFRMWNSDPPGGYRPGVDPLYLCVPVYLAVHDAGSYLVFFENSFPGTFTFPPDDSPELEGPADQISKEEAEVTFEGGMLRYYFIPGPPARALERYSQLTGRAPLPPRWALGYHQSRWGYQSEADIREVADGFIQHDLPISAIHLDIDYMQGYRVFTVDEEKFPDLTGLADSLKKQNIHLVTILDPCVKTDPGYALYREGLENRFFCKLPGQKPIQAMVWPGWSVFPDFTNPKVREWWGSQYPRLISHGISGVWHDMNEPASFSAWGDFTLPTSTVHVMEGRGGTHLEAHNLYGLLMNRTGQEALVKNHPEQRPWILTRSGWAGVARYAWSWTGDIESSWEALRQTVSSLLGLSLSGIPFSGSDIGGFSGIPNPELYLRWFQMAVFTPFFRTHSTIEVPPREPWRFEEPVLSILWDFLRLRYRLLPYLYTLAWECATFGWPLLRPLFWPEAEDSWLWQVDDAFLLGNHLLVAPVLEPSAKSRTVTLPAGDWYDFWDDTLYHGSTEAEIPVDLERIPLLVRAGSLLPLVEGDDITLHLYPARSSSSKISLYSDAGDGYGDWRLDHFKMDEKENEIEVCRTQEGSFSFPYQSILIHLHGIQPDQAWVDGNQTPVKGNVLEVGYFNRIHLSLPARNVRMLY